MIFFYFCVFYEVRRNFLCHDKNFKTKILFFCAKCLGIELLFRFDGLSPAGHQKIVSYGVQCGVVILNLFYSLWGFKKKADPYQVFNHPSVFHDDVHCTQT